MRSNYRSERATVLRTYGKATLRRAISTLEARVAECERFYHWPALAESWRADLRLLRDRLDAIQSK
jgi:hypothetical protein